MKRAPHPISRPTPLAHSIASLLLLAACAAPLSLSAQDADSAEERLSRPAVESVGPATLDEVVVTGEAQEDAVTERLAEVRENYPGSVSTVTPEQLKLQNASNIGEVLVRVPGVSYIDEDGRGTKPNIGLRGLNPLRSEFTQLRMDGLPIQPSIYSEQAGYYGVPAERVFGIEIYKGGSSILYGPNTVGGVVNFLTRPFSPEPFAGALDVRWESYGDYSGNIYVGGTLGKFSYGLEYMHKEGDGFRDSLGFNIDDVDAKVRYQLDEKNAAQIHFQYYDEQSETPGGLLPSQMGDREQSNKKQDEFFGKRIAGDVLTTHQLTETQRLELFFYTYYFKRDWYLQKYVSDSTTDLTLADTNEQFLRDFTVVGFEPKYTLDYDLGNSTGHRLTIGGRLYYDAVDRSVRAGKRGHSRKGDSILTSDEELSTFVLAGYIQNEFKLTSRLSLVPGLRYEHIDQTKEDVLNSGDEQKSGDSVWLPGLGLKYEFAPKSMIYGNITRSFRPPTFGEAFNPATGTSNIDLEASTAWTYEVGARTNPYPWLLADVGVFYTDFQDQVVQSGSTLVNADTLTYGFEGFVELGLFGLTHYLQTKDPVYTGDHEVFLQAGATLVDSTIQGGPDDGNDVAYVPKTSVTFGVMYEYKKLVSLLFQGRYIGSRFSDSANTAVENEIGTVGELSDYTVFDVKARWQATESIALSAGVNNLFDESYGTQRRTGSQKGIFPGPTRSVYVSATYEF